MTDYKREKYFKPNYFPLYFNFDVKMQISSHSIQTMSPPAPCIVPDIEFGSINNVSPRQPVIHGFTINVTCDHDYELAFGSALPKCFNGTWSKYPKCHPGKY